MKIDPDGAKFSLLFPLSNRASHRGPGLPSNWGGGPVESIHA